jgi:hypothetical protein
MRFKAKTCYLLCAKKINIKYYLRIESGQLLSTTVQEGIIYHLLVLYISQLVQTYCTSTTKHYPMRKKFVNMNFERVSLGLYFVVEGFFNQKV